MTCDTCRELLSEGLDLCVRARSMDAMDRRAATLAASSHAESWVESGLFDKYVERHNIDRPDTPISTRSGTVALWLEEQYQTDLAAWERKSRHHLMQGCSHG
ncbi:hypothetical protein SAMN05892877_11798 [Rhizobium subbaraonis]|uniref:Uncharacterized protein n=1 Tax=Rhizobium subbaraonis TaxID=908946 RepID=A0A285UV70_9HYPH|nr:hypothetical protein [Rhizobium subbaraonis]SOC45709.1 hypothetical protein SAMN05892877_11798 [Rhizobium subbaraonis]